MLSLIIIGTAIIIIIAILRFLADQINEITERITVFLVFSGRDIEIEGIGA